MPDIDIDFTYGLPPAGHLSKDIVEKTMPIAEITPAEPQFSKGMNLFTLKEESGKFQNLL